MQVGYADFLAVLATLSDQSVGAEMPGFRLAAKVAGSPSRGRAIALAPEASTESPGLMKLARLT